MRIAITTYLYPEAINYVYKMFPMLSEQSYLDQKKIIDSHISIWASGWEDTLQNNNIPTITIPTNVDRFLKRWAEENTHQHLNKGEIVIEMLKKFQPEILFYDLYDENLLEQIRACIPSIKLVALWKGSPPVGMGIFKHVDLTISCAPEEVSYLNKLGFKAEHLHHAFNKNILEENLTADKQYDIVFIGQIFKAIGFHIKRDQALKKLIEELNLNIFTSAYDLTTYDFAKHFTKKVIFSALLPFYFVGNIISGKYKAQLEKALVYPITPYSPRLKKFLRAPVYGKKMYEVTNSTKVIFNIHADSSPLYASNMRLFESTGVGGCLLTDWKENINELFEDNYEIITYRTVEECVEKAKWLLNHDKERNLIALAGQKRVFSSHLFEHRLPQLLEIFKKHIK